MNSLEGKNVIDCDIEPYHLIFVTISSRISRTRWSNYTNWTNFMVCSFQSFSPCHRIATSSHLLAIICLAKRHAAIIGCHSEARDASSKQMLIGLSICRRHFFRCTTARWDKTIEETKFIRLTVLHNQSSASGHPSLATALYTSKVQNAFQKYLHYRQDDGGKLTAYVGLHSIAQHRPYIQSHKDSCSSKYQGTYIGINKLRLSSHDKIELTTSRG